MFIKKVSIIGKSRGLILDRPILELYKISEEVEIRPTSDGQGFEVRPVLDSNERHEKVKKALVDGNKRYGRMLKKLA